MENQVLIMVAVLAKLDLLKKEEAEKLANELRNALLPSLYKDSVILIDRVFEKIKAK
jgi:hypothetical protein